MEMPESNPLRLQQTEVRYLGTSERQDSASLVLDLELKVVPL